MNDPVAYFIRGLLRQPNASYARRYLGITDTTGGGTGTGGGGGGPAISAGANSQSTGTVIFSNSNGLTFGLNAGTLTASHNGITSQSNQAASASNGSFTFQTLGFSNANNVTFGTSAGSIITASVSPPGAASVNFSAGTTSGNLDSVVFSNSNNATFGLNGSTITMSHEVSLNQVLDPSDDARFLMNTRQVQFQWGTNLTDFTTNASRQGLFEIDVIGGTAFATDSTTHAEVVHIHHSSNNPYLHMLHIQADGTNATGIHMEISGPVGMEINRPISYDGGSVPMILGTSQSNLVSNLNAFYLEGARSSQFLTSQSNQAASASNGSFTFQTLNFSNANNVTFGTSAGGIVTASVVAGAAADAIRGIAAGGSTATTNTVNFSDLNGISFGFGVGANSTVITASHDGLTSQSNQAASASNGSFAFQTINFSNANNVTFGTSAGSIISASVAAPGVLFTAGTTASQLSSILFSNASNVSFGLSVAAGAGTMTASVAAQSTQPVAASASNGSFAFSTLGFSNANNVTFGTSAGSIITASVAAPGGAGAARSYFQWPEAVANSQAIVMSGSSKHLQPFRLPFDLSVSYLRMPISLSCVGSNANTTTAANQTVGATISSTFQLAFYSLGTGANSRVLQSYFTTQHTWVQRLTIQAAGVGSNWSSGHTISYPMSSSASAAFTVSGAATSASRTMNSSVISNFTNIRCLDLLMETSFSAGNWWMAWNSSTSVSTSVSNWLSTQRIIASNFAVAQPPQTGNLMNAATNLTNLYQVGLGSWSTNSVGTTTASISLGNISCRASNPIINFEMIRQA